MDGSEVDLAKQYGINSDSEMLEEEATTKNLSFYDSSDEELSRGETFDRYNSSKTSIRITDSTDDEEKSDSDGDPAESSGVEATAKNTHFSDLKDGTVDCGEKSDSDGDFETTNTKAGKNHLKIKLSRIHLNCQKHFCIMLSKLF